MKVLSEGVMKLSHLQAILVSGDLEIRSTSLNVEVDLQICVIHMW